MSYIPKYILKRMVPDNAVKVVANNIEITIVNVISPLTIEDIPEGDLSQYVDIALDGKWYEGAAKQDFVNKIELRYEDKAVTLKNVRQFSGLTLPVGGQIKLVAPNTGGWKAGETHSVTVKINLDNPVEITAERKVG